MTCSESYSHNRKRINDGIKRRRDYDKTLVPLSFYEDNVGKRISRRLEENFNYNDNEWDCEIECRANEDKCVYHSSDASPEDRKEPIEDRFENKEYIVIINSEFSELTISHQSAERVIFLDCTFNGDVYFKTCSFQELWLSNCDIEGDFVLDDCKITCYLRMSATNISGDFKVRGESTSINRSYLVSSSIGGRTIFNDIDLLQGEWFFDYSLFKCSVNLSGLKIQGSLNFRDANFLGKIDVSYSEIQSEVNFKHGYFKESIDFGETRIKGDLNFEKSDVEDELVLNNCEVSEATVSFEESDIKSKAQLYKSKFDCESELKFIKADIKSTLSLNEAELEGKVILDYCKVENLNCPDVDLSESNLQKASISSGNMKNSKFIKSNFKDATIKNVNMKNSKFIKSNFKDATIKNVNIRECDFRRSKLSGVRFDITRIDRKTKFLGNPYGTSRNRCISVDPYSQWKENDYNQGLLVSLMYVTKSQTYETISLLLSILKISYVLDIIKQKSGSHTNRIISKIGYINSIYGRFKNKEQSFKKNRESFKDDLNEAETVYQTLEDLAKESSNGFLYARCFYRRQIMKRNQYKMNSFYLNSSYKEGISNLLSYTKSVSSAITIGYGEKISRIVILSILVILLCALVYWWTGSIQYDGAESGINRTVDGFGHAIYYSSISFISSNFGSYTVTSGISKFVTVLQSTVGVVFLALLVFVVSRRAER
jgi:uncharacterized protein YjbI with pentapeptide repeats